LARLEQARQQCSPVLASQAEALLAGYLEVWGNEPEANATRFHYAELLWDLQRPDEATEQHRMVVLADPTGLFAERAARRVVQSRFFRSCGWVGDDPARGRLPMALWNLRDLEAYDFYLRYFPRSEYAAFVRERRASVFYDHNHFPEAFRPSRRSSGARRPPTSSPGRRRACSRACGRWETAAVPPPGRAASARFPA